ncbi:MAG TPA: CocE/NonD family hydrolase [Frankiaceae bacterium]|nr:CocE/NonD family hydrolase [Frankiaceae bacterium]
MTSFRLVRRSLAAVGLVAGLLALPAAGAPVPSGYAYTHHWFTAKDGTQLHAGVFLPKNRKANERHPVLLTSTPYTAPGAGGPDSEGPAIRFPELFEHQRFKAGRWAYVQIDVRGFGGSGGCFEYYLPNEASDVKTAVEWAATQKWSTGKVGMWGKSYDAAQQVLALGSKPKGLAATVIQAPGLSAYTALWMNGVHYATGRYATTATYTADDLTPPQNQSTLTSEEYATAAAAPVTDAPDSPTCRTDAVVGMNVESDRAGAFWKGKEPYRAAAGSKVPTLWSHGFWDANTKPVHVDIWKSLRGPKQAWFGQYTHLRGHEGGVGREGFLDESFRFLDRYVRGIRPPKADPVVTVQSGNGPGRWRAERAWPPTDARTWTMPVLNGTYRDQPGNNGTGSSGGKGSWSVTKPLAGAAHLAGEVVLNATVTGTVPGVHVVAHLYDIDDSGQAVLVTRGALATKSLGAQKVRFALYPQDWVFAKGHRIGIVLSGSDDAWFAPGTSLTDVGISKASLALPLLRYTRTSFLKGDESDGMNSNPVTVPADVLSGREVRGQPPRQQRR